MVSNGDVNMLDLLRASKLTAVTFIHDYIQLAFEKVSPSGIAEQYALSAYTVPRVTLLGKTIGWDETGYRDALCARIGRSIMRTIITPEDATLIFEDGTRVSISLAEKDYRGPEAFQLTDGKGLIVVQ